MSADQQGSGAKSLALVDQVLAAKPQKDDYVLSDAMETLCIFRDELIAKAEETGAPEDARRLSHVNAVISVVAGVHFPLGETPWNELTKAREWLAALAGQG